MEAFRAKFGGIFGCISLNALEKREKLSQRAFAATPDNLYYVNIIG